MRVLYGEERNKKDALSESLEEVREAFEEEREEWDKLTEESNWEKKSLCDRLEDMDAHVSALGQRDEEQVSFMRDMTDRLSMAEEERERRDVEIQRKEEVISAFLP